MVLPSQLVETATASITDASTLRHVPCCRSGYSCNLADHVEPHRGDYNKFRLGRLQSLCAHCHSSTKAIVEKRGYDPTIGTDGLDPRHPIYRFR
jgi:hypothetical protein